MSGDQLDLDAIRARALWSPNGPAATDEIREDVLALVAEVRMLREDVAVLRRALDEIGPR